MTSKDAKLTASIAESDCKGLPLGLGDLNAGLGYIE